MSKYKIVPLPPTWDMRMAAADAGIVDWRVDANGVPIEVGECTAEIVFEAMANAAPAPVASAEDVERVAEALWLAQTLRLLRDAPEQARLEYAELDDATKGHLRWDARAAL